MSRKRARRRAADMYKGKASIATTDAFSNALTRAGSGMPNAIEATSYPLTRLTQNYQQLNSLYRGHWVIQKIINTVPQDMLKNGYDIQSDLRPDQIQEIIKIIRRTGLHAKILEGLYWGRLYGGAVGIIIIDGEGEIMDEPLELDMIMPNSFKGIMILDRWSGIEPEATELITDISDPEFGLPKFYRIDMPSGQGSVRIHHSRICRFIGREMPYLEKLAENYWGTSEVEHIIDDLKKRDNVSWNIALLTFMANIRVMRLEGMEEILALGGTKAQEALYSVLEGMNSMLSNNGIQILGKDDGYESHQYTFSGLGEVYDRFMMDVAGAAGIPVAKLFGRSPAGLNATGDADLQNYYDTVEQYQESQLRPVLDKLLPIVAMSALGAIPDDLDFSFNPIRRSNDSEKQDLGSIQTQAVTAAYIAGLVSQKTALQELQQASKRTGMWSNITDEQIAEADDQVEASGEMAPPGVPMMDADWDPGMKTQDSDFKEEEHPRDDTGKFVSGPVRMSKKKNPMSSEEAYEKQIGRAIPGNYTGLEAIKKLRIEQGGYIENAFIRTDIGGINLPWGDDTMGLKHIIQERSRQGVDIEKFLPFLPEIIEKGTLQLDRGRFQIKKDGYTAIVSPTFFGDNFQFLLTGWDDSVPKTKKR